MLLSMDNYWIEEKIGRGKTLDDIARLMWNPSYICTIILFLCKLMLYRNSNPVLWFGLSFLRVLWYQFCSTSSSWFSQQTHQASTMMSSLVTCAVRTSLSRSGCREGTGKPAWKGELSEAAARKNFLLWCGNIDWFFTHAVPWKSKKIAKGEISPSFRNKSLMKKHPLRRDLASKCPKCQGCLRMWTRYTTGHRHRHYHHHHYHVEKFTNWTDKNQFCTLAKN